MTGSDSILNTDFFRPGLSGRNFWLTEEVKSSIINSYKINGKEKTDVSADNNSCATDTHEDNKKRGILLRKTDLQNAVSFILLTVYPVLRMKKQII